MAGERQEQEAREVLLAEFRPQMQALGDDDEKLIELIREFNQRWAEISSKIAEEYPLDVPNDKCKHAFLKGLALDNQTWISGSPVSLPSKGDVVPLCRVGAEEVSVWTEDRDHYSVFLVKSDPDRIPAQLWKTAASIMSVLIALTSAMESIPKVEYAWIYDFAPKKAIQEQELLDDNDRFTPGNRVIHRLDHWFESAPVMELLERDEKFFVAAQLLTQSFREHWFCLECAMRPPQSRTHNHAEPDPWSLVSEMPAMESAIVSATRAAEGLLGQPGKTDRLRTRWTDATTVDPDAHFLWANKTYIEYYKLDLFDVRNDSAHSYGTISAGLTRARAIAAQTFAHEIVLGRYKKLALSTKEAQERLSFYAALKSNILSGPYPEMSTLRTAESGFFR